MTCAIRRFGLLLCALVLPFAASAGDPPNVWTARTSGTTQALAAVAFGNGTFVAVGYGGTILTSPDGRVWTTRLDPSGRPFTSRNLQGVAYSDLWSAFIAVGDTGTVLVSQDQGVTWDVVLVPFTENLRSVTVGAGTPGGSRIVAVGGSKVATTSYPWGGWTIQDLSAYGAPTPQLLAVASNGEMIVTVLNPDPFFVAVGGRGQMFVSRDAAQWTAVGCSYQGNIVAVAHFIADSFTAIGQEDTPSGRVERLLFVYHDTGALPSSATCRTEGTPVTPAGSWAMEAIAFGSLSDLNDYWVVAGGGEIYTSRYGDRHNWYITWRGDRSFEGLAYGRGSFVAVGASGAIYQSSTGGSGSVYLGCFTDDSNRALPIRLMPSGATVGSCLAEAKARGLTYFGLQWYGVCYGGYAPGYSRDEGQCTTPCSTYPAQTCGGAWHNSLYTTGVLLDLPDSRLGCYLDDSSRKLKARLIDSGATAASCIAAAAARGFRYAGLQWYGQCFAGDSPGTREPTEASCNTPCDANPSERCGGAWHNTVYATGATPVSLPPVSSLHLGCYTDDANRALPAKLISSGATVETCIAAAKAMGYAYAGLQWYGTCYGGSSLGYSKVTTVPSPCNTPCDADPSETCGGGWHNSVYATPP